MKSVLLFLAATGLSYVLNQILLRFSKNFGVSSRQEQSNFVRWASASKPTTGGISFYITFLIGSLVLFLLEPQGGISAQQYLALFLGASLAFLVGFADDAYGTHPMMKLLGQAGCGVILIAFGISIRFFSLWGPEWLLLDYLLTLFWVVGMMNSLNMLDNMDGVTGSIATTISVSTLAMMISQEGLTNLFSVVLVIVGGFVGFLFWNWKPAKVYMGDTGSMFIGLVLAYFGILYFWNIYSTPDNISQLRTGLIPLMVFIVPIMDTTFVTVARLARGQSPFVGGKDHLTHNLVRIGIPESFVPVTLGIVSTVSGMLAFFAYKLIPEWRTAYTVIFGAYPVALFALFAYLYRNGARIAAVKEKMEQRARAAQERQAAEASQPVVSSQD
jgi:UDP-GlcNAc:undecaprenyl-phosphate GlcNAc-1-phosphate transferase